MHSDIIEYVSFAPYLGDLGGVAVCSNCLTETAAVLLC